MRKIKKRMQALLDGFDYDFSQFTLEDFRRWLEQRRGRKIVLTAVPMDSPTTSGIWLAGDDTDFVFFPQDALPIYQVHIQLHEFAHILCGHPTLRVGRQELSVMFRGTIAEECANQEDTILPLHLIHSPEAEQEAETLASLIQKQVLRHGRIRELLKTPSSHEHIADFITGAELN